MKKSSRILSLALIVAMLLTVSAVAFADDTTVYIPKKLVKLGVPDKPHAPKLTTSNDGNDIELQFGEKVDYAIVNWSEGEELLDVDDTGYAVTSRDGHKLQPGTQAFNSTATYKDEDGKTHLRFGCDPLTGKIIDKATGDIIPTEVAVEAGIHVVYGDEAYVAGKGSVRASYARSGHINYIVKTTEEDYFQTGLEGAKSEITYTYYKQKVLRNKNTGKTGYESGYYVSTVSATYPAGEEYPCIVKVQADYRNDENNTLASYKITYATSDSETYEITYAPATNTVLQMGSKFYNSIAGVDIPDNTASHQYAPGVALIHRNQDQVVCGLYRKGSLVLCSGSGKKLGNWYKYNGTVNAYNIPEYLKSNAKVNNLGKQYKNSKYGLKKCTSFASPRVE